MEIFLVQLVVFIVDSVGCREVASPAECWSCAEQVRKTPLMKSIEKKCKKNPGTDDIAFCWEAVSPAWYLSSAG